VYSEEAREWENLSARLADRRALEGLVGDEWAGEELLEFSEGRKERKALRRFLRFCGSGPWMPAEEPREESEGEGGNLQARGLETKGRQEA